MKVVAALSNSDFAYLLAQAAEEAEGVRVKAFRRAARSAFLWPEEVAEMVRAGRDLTELASIGPFMARLLTEWLEKPPPRARRRDPLRMDFLTLAAARRILARQPGWRKHLRGDLHMHTTWSDGSASVAEMQAAGRAAGYEFIAITDHAKGLKIAGGIDEKQIARQAREIAQANAVDASTTVLRSIELNLSAQGEGDLTNACLRSLDIVLGSFHSALRSKEDQTPRYLAALRKPELHTLGHPRGRVYDYRLGLTADWPRVFAEAARLDKALEIDCYPDRQDLNVALLKQARGAGCRIALGTDAHHPWQLEFIELGLAAALKARIAPERIINFMPLRELRAWIAGLRDRSSAKTKRKNLPKRAGKSKN